MLAPRGSRIGKVTISGALGTFIYYVLLIYLTVIYSIKFSSYGPEVCSLYAAFITICFIGPLWIVADPPQWILIYYSTFLGFVVYFCMQVPNKLELISIAFLATSVGLAVPLFRYLKTIQSKLIIALFVWVALLIYTAPVCLRTSTTRIVYHGKNEQIDATYDKIESRTECVDLRLGYLGEFIVIMIIGLAGWVAAAVLGESEGWFRE